MARKIAVEIVGDSRSLEKAFKRSAAGAKNFNTDISKVGPKRSLFGGLGKTIGLATGALGVGGLAGAAKAAFQEMQDAQKVSAQTAAALKSTHGAAGITADQVDKLATSLSNMSGVDDEAIKSSENLLLTFTNIRNQTGKNNDIFNQATKTALDMSTALGQDGKTSAIQLGKALNDPVKGITALQRVGVSFTADQKKQIKSLVDSGKTMEAQKLILRELNREFGGSAKAAGDTLPGKLNKLKETLLNLGGSIAEMLTPKVTEIADKMVKWLQDTDNQKQVLDTIKSVIGTLGTAVGVLKTAFDGLSTAVGGSKNAIKLLIAAYAGFKAVQIAGKVGQLASAFGGLTGKTKTATTAAGNLRGSLIGKAGLMGAALGLGVVVGTAIRNLTPLGDYLDGLAQKLADLKDPMREFGKTGTKPASGRLFHRARREAGTLAAAGATPAQIQTFLLRAHPMKFAQRDVEVLSGARGRAPTVHYNINNLNIHGARDINAIEQALLRRSRQRPHRRRGT